LLSDIESEQKRYSNNDIGSPYVKLRLYILDIKLKTLSLIRNVVASPQLVPSVTDLRIRFDSRLNFYSHFD
jgi:hypothetical protein